MPRFAVPENDADRWLRLVSGWRRQLALAPFIARLKDAGVPGFILGMDGAEPPPADTAVECCGGITGLIHGRNGLTRPFEVSGFCLIHLLQHIPSSYGQYTLGSRRGDCHDERKLVYGCLPADDQQAAGVEPKSENLVRGADGEISRDRLREFSGGKVLEHTKLIEAKPNPKRRERFRRDVDEQGFLLGYKRDAADEVNGGVVGMKDDLEFGVRLLKMVEQFAAFLSCG
jgi:hypothetical protein